MPLSQGGKSTESMSLVFIAFLWAKSSFSNNSWIPRLARMRDQGSTSFQSPLDALCSIGPHHAELL